MMSSDLAALSPIESALDRFREAHFWIHTLEQYYHYADPFRWHLNSFLKSIKEVPQLLQMGLQNRKGFPQWFCTQSKSLSSDPLLHYLAKKRDFVVHRGMFVPSSHGAIGITEGRGFKLGLTFPVHPFEDSEDAMHRYLQHILDHGDVLQILMPDEDSMPCIHRVWRIQPFEEEVVELASRAWLRMGETINTIVKWMGAEPQQLLLSCRHSSHHVQFKLFARAALNKQLRAIRREAKSKTPHGNA